MKRKRLLTLVLAVVMSLNTHAVFASESKEAQSVVTVDSEPVQMVVTVPAILPVSVSQTGVTLTATDAKVTNHSYGPVRVTAIEVIPVAEWELVPESYDFTGERVGAHVIQVSIQERAAESDGAIPKVSEWEPISGNSDYGFSYGVKIPAQKSRVDAVLAKVVFTIDWDEPKELTHENLQINYSKAKSMMGYEDSEELSIPESFVYEDAMYHVSGIDSYGFSTLGDKSVPAIKEVQLPNTVKSIGTGAFQGQAELSSIELPEDIERIDEFAFYGCEQLEYISVPSGMTKWMMAFEVSGLEEVNIEDGVDYIASYAFYKCENLSKITFPNTLKRICDTAFSGCTSLTEVVLPDSVEEIDGGAFENCYNLKSIVIPNGLKYMASETFSGCSSLATPMRIPDGQTIVGGKTFAYCGSLPSVTIPDSVTTIGDNAFINCSALKFIEIPNSVTSIGRYAFYGCSGLESIVIPGSVDEIKDYAFCGCSGAKSITIQDGVRIIRQHAFNRGYPSTAIDEVVVPDSVTIIEPGAFTGVKHITYHGPRTYGAPWGASSMN